jgi:hypothetical protein
MNKDDMSRTSSGCLHRQPLDGTGRKCAEVVVEAMQTAVHTSQKAHKSTGATPTACPSESRGHAAATASVAGTRTASSGMYREPVLRSRNAWIQGRGHVQGTCADSPLRFRSLRLGSLKLSRQ